MTVKITKNTMTPALAKIERQLQTLPAQAYQVWQRETPIKSGNARRKTRLRGDTIDANYPYAQRLNEGWSKQSPDGMQKPVEEFIKQYVNKLGK